MGNAQTLSHRFISMHSSETVWIFKALHCWLRKRGEYKIFTHQKRHFRQHPKAVQFFPLKSRGANSIQQLL